MKRGFNRWIVVAGLILMTSGVLCAQEVKFPRVSPSATVSQSIGLSNVTISFCRPGVKGRVIWGGLVPYDQVWRTGANEATTIAFSTDVAIEGNKLAAGTYGLFTIPGKRNGPSSSASRRRFGAALRTMRSRMSSASRPSRKQRLTANG